MLFKWNKQNKNTGTIEVEYGYHGHRKVIGTLLKSKGSINATLVFENGTQIGVSTKKAKDAKEFCIREYSDYQNEMVTVVNCLTQKEVQIPRRNVGGVCDPSMEAYHSF